MLVFANSAYRMSYKIRQTRKFIGIFTTSTKNKTLASNSRMISSSKWKPQDHIPKDVQDLLKRKPKNYVVAFLNIVQLLKTQRRTGWLDHGIEPCESISDHMYRMGVAAMLITNPNVNRDRCVRIALVHDIAESLVGDITPFDPVSKEEKHFRELSTIEYLCNELIKPNNAEAAAEIMQDWLAYENVSSLEARYVKDIDKFEMLVQCFEYEKKYNGTKDLTQFWSAMSSIKTQEVQGWAQELMQERERFFESLEK
ncbi:LAMI_0F07998g1_1 [Lachancea mirantina]|uniref:5'-deoxynucleotidase n=1 Tax=Lachancea mirantina TaxID=1230905 RepID=A0A1G4K055_9SACH|nr:LAMI_0F07998g1_1 [Lachancea mirantina]